jgi:hypothetical protein
LRNTLLTIDGLARFRKPPCAEYAPKPVHAAVAAQVRARSQTVCGTVSCEGEGCRCLAPLDARHISSV